MERFVLTIGTNGQGKYFVVKTFASKSQCDALTLVQPKDNKGETSPLFPSWYGLELYINKKYSYKEVAVINKPVDIKEYFTELDSRFNIQII